MPLNNDTCGSKISLLYDAIREKLESIFILKGYKIYNHECYCSLIKILFSEDIALSFDNYRKIRIDVNYYGVGLDVEDTKDILIGMERLFILSKELRNNYK